MMKCPYCHVELEPNDTIPKDRMEVCLCESCGELVAVEAGAVRKLTTDEHIKHAATAEMQAARRLWVAEKEADAILDSPVMLALVTLREAGKSEKGGGIVFETVFLTAAMRTLETVQKLFRDADVTVPGILINRLNRLYMFLRVEQEENVETLRRTDPKQRRRGGLHN